MQISVDLKRLLCEQVVCLITEKKEHTDHFPFSYIFLYILKRKKRKRNHIQLENSVKTNKL
jgi:hypothetical protein